MGVALVAKGRWLVEGEEIRGEATSGKEDKNKESFVRKRKYIGEFAMKAVN